ARGTYRCQDGKRIVVAAAEPRTWSALCQGLGLDELDGQPGGPPDDKAGTRQKIADALATQPAAHW
ncbi:MAG: CoA transferase, partial [Actinobacteria bacterium]|nr:CoA transferase [Actinomycetota bacterium]NIS35187.1 CoA transferase [Actinomycetota bacterium]NIU69902.1 CoA transferase [Actinomycetota bacterium]NIW31780.1 CoA transferase [Actinomycetota bacterium]